MCFYCIHFTLYAYYVVRLLGHKYGCVYADEEENPYVLISNTRILFTSRNHRVDMVDEMDKQLISQYIHKREESIQKVERSQREAIPTYGLRVISARQIENYSGQTVSKSPTSGKRLFLRMSNCGHISHPPRGPVAGKCTTILKHLLHISRGGGVGCVHGYH